MAKKRRTIIVAVVGLLIAVGLIASACAGDPGSRGEQGPQGEQGPPGPGLTPMTQTFDIYMWEKKAVAEGPMVELIPPTETSADLLTEFYHWEPSVLVVLKGDTVVLNVSNPRGTIHSFGIPSFGVDTGPLTPRGGKATIEFVADRAGTFAYMCTIPWDPTTDPETCHPDHKYQTGVLIVLDR